MSSERDPERDQVAPTPNDGPSCHDLVIKDLEERKAFGLKKYGSLLQPNNGRSFLQDAYEEALDLCAYLRGKLEEEREEAARQRFMADGLRKLCWGGHYGPYNDLCKKKTQMHDPHYVDLADIDRNARAYGWEVGRGAPMNEIVDASPDNPFI